MKKTLLISTCLLGVNCRYDGANNALETSLISDLREKFDLVPICPEQLGGLSTPRLPAELLNDKQVIRKDGVDVSAEFFKGAKEALYVAELYGASLALLKSNSPSCGKNRIYDSTFTGKLIPGQGITVKAFDKHGIKVYNENEINDLINRKV